MPTSEEQRMTLKPHGNQTGRWWQDWWKEWFGIYGGRELGTNKSPHREFIDNPDHILSFIEMCERENRPMWVTAQPFSAYGIPMALEKAYFDFDDDTKYCPKCDKFIKKKQLIKSDKSLGKGKTCCPKHPNQVCEERPRKDVVGVEVKKFVQRITRYEPLIVETRKGYHVYIFLRRVFSFSHKHHKFAKLVYEQLLKRFYREGEFEFLDTSVVKDIMRLARVPLTMHEKSGEICRIVDRNLKETKVRSVEFYRQYGIPDSVIKHAIDVAQIVEKEKAKEIEERAQEAKLNMGDGNGFQGRIRPCFQVKMKQGVMNHTMRLALLLEAYWAGYRDEEQLVDLFRCFGDFEESVTRYQVKWFLEHGPDRYPPYRCETLISKNWCIEGECSTYLRRQKRW